MKRFILFTCLLYYPSGGWYDFANSYDTLAEATAAGDMYKTTDDCSHYHIVDTESWTIVREE